MPRSRSGLAAAVVGRIAAASRGGALAIALAAAAGVASAQAPTTLTGTTPGGANYTIRVPAGWQPGGPLVMVHRGYSFDFDDDVSTGPLAELQLSQGYAIAASGLRTRGWALFDAIDDNWALYQRFVQLVGEPGRVIAAGGSMGGLVSLKQAEDPRFADRIDAVYALCPPAAGSRAWESGFDLKLSYDAICRGVGGGEFPRGDEPWPWALNLADVPDDLSNLALDGPMVRALARIQQCTGLLVPSFLRTPPQRDRLADLKRISGIDDDEFLALNLGYATFGLAELVRAPDKLAGQNPSTTSASPTPRASARSAMRRSRRGSPGSRANPSRPRACARPPTCAAPAGRRSSRCTPAATS